MIHPQSCRRQRTPLTAFAAGFFSVLFLFFSLAGCGAETPDHPAVLARLAETDASFTAIFPAAYEGGEPVSCAGTKTGGTFLLTVRTPGRSAGVVLAVDPAGGTCVLWTPGYDGERDGIPADSRAARGVTVPFSLLCGGEEPLTDRASVFALPALSRSADGGETVIEFPSGTLVLTPEGVPLRVVCADFSGREREILFEDYVFLP